MVVCYTKDWSTCRYCEFDIFLLGFLISSVQSWNHGIRGGKEQGVDQEACPTTGAV